MFANADDDLPDLEDLVEKTIQDTHPSRTIDDVFHDFTIANIAKEFDSSSLAESIKYIYQDENDGSGAGAYENVKRQSTGTPNMTGTDTIPSWGARYYEADLSNCPDGIAGFRSQGDRAGYGVLVIRQDGTIEKLFKGASTDFKKAIILSKEDERDNPISRLLAVAAGIGDAAEYEYDIACGQASMEIIQPSNMNRAFVGKFDEPERFTIRLRIQGPPELGIPTVQGLDSDDFQVYVGSAIPANEATVISGTEVQGEYWLVAQAPNKTTNGDFDLTVKLRTLTNDSEVSSIRYEEKLLDQVIVIDRSGSMMSPSGFTKMDAARNAASIMADAAGSSSQIGSISFGGDNNEPDYTSPFSDASLDSFLKPANDAHRLDVKSAIMGIPDPAPSVMTSIGDGLDQARQEFIVRGSTVGKDIITLLSDGMENEDLYVADVLPALLSQDIEVHSIALGPHADQPLLQDIATQTGGSFYYVDVGTTAPIMAPTSVSNSVQSIDGSMSTMASTSPLSYPLSLRLADTYLAAYEAASDSSRIFETYGSITSSKDINFSLTESQLEDGRVTIAWSNPDSIVSIKVYENNNLLVDGINGVRIYSGDSHAELQVPNLNVGNWKITITSSKQMEYFAALSAKQREGARLELAFDQVLDPAVLSEGGTFKYGKPIRIVAFLDQNNGGINNVKVNANVKHPSGDLDMLPLFDDGAHNDGNANDGIYANIYRRTTLASPTGLSETPGSTNNPSPSIRGSYNVVVFADGNTHSAPGRSSEAFSRIAKSSFNVLDGQETKADRDYDGMPDVYEDSLECLDKTTPDAANDFDSDTLSNFSEWQGGTNPCEQDSDFGGIHDGSERSLGLNPLDPDDDFIPTPRMVDVIKRSSEHQTDDVQLIPGVVTIRYPTHASYQTIRIFRSTSKLGPYNLLADFSPDGSSIYRDQNGIIGTTYYYRIQAVGTSNAESALSPIISGTPKNDPNPPIGNISIAEGSIVDNLNVNLNMRFDHNDVTHFRVKNLNSPTFNSWVAVQNNSHSVSYPWILQPNNNGDAIVIVQFKDNEDNFSLQYTATTKVVGPGQLGEVRGNVSLTGNVPNNILGSIRVSLTNASNIAVRATIPPVYANANGDYRLASVPPGDYNLLINYGALETISLNVSVSSGGVTSVQNQNIDIPAFEFNTPVMGLYSMLVLSLMLTVFGLIRKSF
ncbi:MAG: VWA domain-containing protein [Pseudomonadota bacterium]|nr:VWA domain-containing protein [Pseudomonadota bacterium]